MIPKTKTLHAYPGDTRVKLTSPCTDTTGKLWAKGTIMTPLWGGYSNVPRCTYQVFSCGVEKVRFEGT